MTSVTKKPTPLLIDTNTRESTSEPAAKRTRTPSPRPGRTPEKTDGRAPARPSTPPPKAASAESPQSFAVPSRTIVRQGRNSAAPERISAPDGDVFTSVPTVTIDRAPDVQALQASPKKPSTPPRPGLGQRGVTTARGESPLKPPSQAARSLSANEAVEGNNKKATPAAAHVDPQTAFRAVREANVKQPGADLRRDAGLLKVLMAQEQGLKTVYFVDSGGKVHYGAHRATEATVMKDGKPVPGAQHKDLFDAVMTSTIQIDKALSIQMKKARFVATTSKRDSAKLGGTRLILNEKAGTLTFSESDFFFFAPPPPAPEGQPHEKGYQDAVAKVAQYNTVIDGLVDYHVSVLKLSGLADRVTGGSQGLAPPSEGGTGNETKLKLVSSKPQTQVLADRVAIALGLTPEAPTPDTEKS